MKTASTRVRLLAGVIGVALIGLAIVQIVLLRKALETENDAFRRNAVVALSKAAEALSSGEILRVAISGMYDSETGEPPSREQVDSILNSLRDDPEASLHAARFIGIDSSVVTTVRNGADSGNSDRRHLIKVEVETALQREKPADSAKIRDRRELRIVSVDSIDYAVGGPGAAICDSAAALHTWRSENGQLSVLRPADSNRAFMVTAALNLLDDRELVPITERVDSLELDSAIAGALQAEGIDLDYRFGVIDASTDSLVMVHGTAKRDALKGSPYRTRLFPYDILSRPNDLVAYFPAKERYIWRQLMPVAIPAALFLLMIAVTFVYTMRLIVGQERFALRLTDFINNMTHEFKTPISTIHLASQALDQEEIAGDVERLRKFNKVIHDENHRMKTHVEKILQMAVIEEGGIEIKREPVDLHEIVRKAVEAVQLNIASRGGQVEDRLEAERSVVDGDEFHLYNVIANLLDNACKYSTGTPMIVIATENVGPAVRLRVTDSGIGIAEEDHKHVFDKYYRVSTGDRHDVKGFGLGLSYVKMVVGACGGQVGLTGALGKGTEVTVELPLSGKDD